MRKTCLQKIDTTEELVEGIQRGEFPDDYNLMCYTNCIMKTLRTFKNGAIDFNMLVKQVDSMMPPDMAARVKDTIQGCRKLEFTGDPCEISYKYVKCYYESDPEAFLFP
ncbi:odorant binding protein 5 [Xylocopa sonorina]|uniref:odorant binding protein 5 n=1 Tax=Xylocopa sonorina TaxID=1818115 RepID=UPI00403AA781